MIWASAKIEHFCKVKSGKRLPKGTSVSDLPSNRRYLRVTDLSDSTIDEKGIKYINESIFSQIKNYTISTNDIYVSIAGTIGRVGIIPESLEGISLTENCCKLTDIDESIIKKEFLMYFLRSPIGQSEMSALTGGASQPKLAITRLKTIDVPIPDLGTQERISSTLCAYDDLIENNLKRINLLEQAAQNIYKEWFVNMRFPGHKNVEFDSETGLPKGWRLGKISSIVRLLGGFAFKSNTYVKDGEYKVITIKNVGDRKFDTSTVNRINNIPTKLKEHCFIREGDILLSLTGNVGRSCIVLGEKNLLNQRVSILKPTNNDWNPFIYWMFNQKDIMSLMNNLATGTAQQNLSPVKLANTIVNIPPDSLINDYCAIASDYYNQIIVLNKLNNNLKQARDILLPRLMNQTIEL